MKKLLWFLLLAPSLVAPVMTSAAFADATIVQKGRRFNPGEITIRRGENLTFTNNDEFIHQIYVTDLSDSDERTPGQTLVEDLQAAMDTCDIAFATQNRFLARLAPYQHQVVTK